jgi:hypothetical protein
MKSHSARTLGDILHILAEVDNLLIIDPDAENRRRLRQLHSVMRLYSLLEGRRGEIGVDNNHISSDPAGQIPGKYLISETKVAHYAEPSV